jgi:hypothetical protein
MIIGEQKKKEKGIEILDLSGGGFICLILNFFMRIFAILSSWLC